MPLKIALITRHAISNYGSLLQTIATQRILQDLQCECEVIDYIRRDENYFNQEKTLMQQKIAFNKSFIKRSLYLLLRWPESIIAGIRFEKMRQKYLNLSRRFSSIDELQSDTPSADIYMTGSDQVWGPVMNGTYDSAYCLSFVKDDRYKVAFSASFGRNNLNVAQQQFFAQWLSHYRFISVREDSAVQMLSSLGIEASRIIDPTLLLSRSYWESIVEEPRKRRYKKKYILVYQIHNDKRLSKYANILAKKISLPIIRVSASFHQAFRGGKFKYCPNISSFLSYIKHAAMVITDSFHGTAFAINFNIPFIEILPPKTGTRILEILKLTELTDRIMNEIEDMDRLLMPMDFSNANKLLEKNRKEGWNILKKMIDTRKKDVIL